MAFLNKNSARAGRRQGGVGMIEVLISIAISAFALLGLAGLQMTALKYQKVAHFRSLASQFGADMADRIRANASAVTKAATTGATTGAATYHRPTDKYSTEPPSTVPPCANNSLQACATPQDIADKDIYEWRVALNRAMAGGWGNVSAYDADTGLTVTVYYNEPDKALTNSGNSHCDLSAFPADVDRNSIRCHKTTVTP